MEFCIYIAVTISTKTYKKNLQFTRWLFTPIKYIMTFAVWKCCLYIYKIMSLCSDMMHPSFIWKFSISLSLILVCILMEICVIHLIMMHKMNMVWVIQLVHLFLSVFITLLTCVLKFYIICFILLCVHITQLFSKQICFISNILVEVEIKL